MAGKCRRAVLIGLDGLEPRLVEPMLERGELPNLASLRARGSYMRVATTSPAQTPVAWSSVATGTNPGGHGVFDFLRRDPATYLPDLALNKYERKNAFTPPRAVNLRRGQTVWDLLDQAGLPSVVLRFPCTYPPSLRLGRMLSGMGVPDLRGGLGTGTFYTTRENVLAGEGEQVVKLENSADGTYTTHLIGPRDPRHRGDTHLPMTLKPEGERLLVRCGGQEIRLVSGVWSDWLRITFKLGALQSVRGMARLLLVPPANGDELAMYASPMNFDPAAPPFAISQPERFAAELADDLGPYYTTGMVEDHAALSNGRIDERAFLDQCAEVWDEREAMMLRELQRCDSGFFYCLFDTTDRVPHLFWRYREPDHPANRERPLRSEFRHAIEETYRRADAAVGAALEAVDDRDLVLVLSDHGFGPFRRCVDLNAWLREQGLLHLADGRAPGRDAGEMLRGIDWSRTRAYAVGLGGIYLNLRGREAKGTVEPGEADQLAGEIQRGLTGLIDPATGEVAVRAVPTRAELYQGPFAAESPDLVVHCGRGFRVSWSTSLGGVAASVFEDNTNAWSGDHIIDPALVPGILFSNRPLNGRDARLVDVAPTVLDALGLAKGPAMEGSSRLP